MSTQNLAVKLCGVLQSQSKEEVTAREWRLIGQEQDGSQLFSWITIDKSGDQLLNLGIYTNKTKTLSILHTFGKRLNIVQASVNQSQSVLVYTVKELPKADSELNQAIYRPYLLCLLPDKENIPISIEEGSIKQTMVQYIYGKSLKYNPGVRNDRFMLFRHLDSIKIYRTTLVSTESDDGLEVWHFDNTLPEPDTVVRMFSWAQWDCVNQVLYYIHYRSPPQSFAEEEGARSPCEVTPTLSALQFHADLPHETVLNIPLNLPHVPLGSEGAACGEYEDSPAPLRIRDCTLDLLVVSDSSGVLCICHHYLYKPLDESLSSLRLEDSTELKETGVNFAYSVTLLHHGCVVHSVVPDVPWMLAKSLRPSYTLYEDNHLLVNIPMLFTHLLDVSLSHEPCCHIVLPNEEDNKNPSLAPLVGWPPQCAVDLLSLDVHTVHVSPARLSSAFREVQDQQNRLAILHYLMQHQHSNHTADELVAWQCLNQQDYTNTFHHVMQEYLIGNTYAFTKRSLPNSAQGLVGALPFTHHPQCGDVKINNVTISVSQEKLWNSAVVVLGPRQRVKQFTEDQWTRLWAKLNTTKQEPRFNPQAVIDKLRASLICYQPESVSRSCTPVVEGGSGIGSWARRSSLTALDTLPFLEGDLCTASKQEHVIAANQRELSLYLMRMSSSDTVNVVATRWVVTQLEVSRALCRRLCEVLNMTPAQQHNKGFPLIDALKPGQAQILFKVLEQYYLAVDSIAFPLPQGFTSFFSYLGFRALPYSMYTQYVHRGVLELQIDVVKAIVADKDDCSRTVDRKLQLIQLSGEGRARRALNSWSHRSALVMRARDHAATLLSGGSTSHYDQSKHRTSKNMPGVAALPSGDHLSPLDTFLDLLTAKASLNELDFNLIIEATLVLNERSKT